MTLPWPEEELSREEWVRLLAEPEPRAAGGPGSGNYGHAGRPGEVGGSAPGGSVHESAPGSTGSSVASVAHPDRSKWVTTEYGYGVEERRDLGDTLASAEKIIRSEPFETAAIFQPDGVRMVAITQSRPDACFIPTAIMDQVRNQNVTFTHNHPQNDAFSPQDIGMAIKLNVAEIRACTKEGTWIMKRGPKGWPDLTTYADTFNPIHEGVRSEFQAAIDHNEMSPFQAQRMHWREVWTRFLGKLPGRMKFSFKPLKGKVERIAAALNPEELEPGIIPNEHADGMLLDDRILSEPLYGPDSFNPEVA